MIRRLNIVLSVSMLLVVVVLPVSASPPIVKTINEFEFEVPSPDSGCDFGIHVIGSNKIQVRVDGLTVIQHNNFKSTVTNLSNLQSFDDNGTWKDTFTFDEDGNLLTIDTTGSIFRITMPGQGIVAQDTGKILFDPVTGEKLFEAGPHEAFDGDVDFCALLGGSEI